MLSNKNVTSACSEGDDKDSNSYNSKTIDESSITASTKVPGKDDIISRNEIKVIDALSINTFANLSDF